MDQELSQKTFESRLVNIKNIMTYVDIKPKSPFIAIVLHEHFGLQNYLRLVAQAIIDNQYSIIMPSIFNDDEEKGEEDDEKFLQNLDHAAIAETILTIISHAKRERKKVIMIGFSVGAAIGAKILEYTKQVDMAFFFYGLPPLQNVKPQTISTITTFFLGDNDKMKYLSDKSLIKKAKKIYQSNQIIEVIEIEGGKHGFMNPACQDYSQSHFQSCCRYVQQKIQDYLYQLQNNNNFVQNQDSQQAQSLNKNNSIKKNKQSQPQKKDQKQQQSNCSLI